MIISMVSFRFWIFILSYLLLFLVFAIYCTAWTMASLITSSISISASQNRQRPVGEEQRRMNTGIWMKGGGHCYSSLMFFIKITFPCPSMCPPPPRFAVTMEDTWSSGIWVEVISHFQMEVLCSVCWNAQVMTGAGAAMLDQR